MNKPGNGADERYQAPGAAGVMRKGKKPDRPAWRMPWIGALLSGVLGGLFVMDTVASRLSAVVNWDGLIIYLFCGFYRYRSRTDHRPCGVGNAIEAGSAVVIAMALLGGWVSGLVGLFFDAVFSLQFVFAGHLLFRCCRHFFPSRCRGQMRKYWADCLTAQSFVSGSLGLHRGYLKIE